MFAFKRPWFTQSKAFERSMNTAPASPLLSMLFLKYCKKFNKTCCVLYPCLNPQNSNRVAVRNTSMTLALTHDDTLKSYLDTLKLHFCVVWRTIQLCIRDIMGSFISYKIAIFDNISDYTIFHIYLFIYLLNHTVYTFV